MRIKNSTKGKLNMSSEEKKDPFAPESIEKKYKYFDLDIFEKKEETRTAVFQPARTLTEAHERLGGDDAVLLKALNSFLKASLLSELEQSVVSKGGRTSAVMAAVKPFRNFPPFSKIADRAEQTKAIINMIKKNPDMIDSIKLASQTAVEGDEESEEEGVA